MMPGCFLARCPSIQAATREPGQTVSIGERNAGVHFAMFDSGSSESPSLNGQPSRTESSSAIVDLPDPRHAHDHEDRRPPPIARALSRRWTPAASATKDRIGAADEKPAFRHTDDTPDAYLQSRRIGIGPNRNQNDGCRCR